MTKHIEAWDPNILKVEKIEIAFLLKSSYVTMFHILVGTGVTMKDRELR